MSIEELAFVLVVRATAELDVVHRGFASHAMRVHVMELDEAPLVAAPPSPAQERAGTAVTQPHRSPDLGRDIPAATRRTATGPRSRRRREFLPSQVLEQRRQRAIEHFREIPGGEGVSEQVLSLA